VAAPSQRRALGALFLVLAAAFAGVAVESIRSYAGARSVVIGLASAAIAFWLAGLAFRALRRA
jgi:hypothetical protein